MFDAFSDGYCPQCLLEGRRVALKLNQADFWECPDCHLQAHTRSLGMLAVMRTRGNCRVFRREVAPDCVIGWVVCRAAAEAPYKPGGELGSEAELRTFLASVK